MRESLGEGSRSGLAARLRAVRLDLLAQVWVGGDTDGERRAVIEELELLKNACAGAQARVTVAFADSQVEQLVSSGTDLVLARRSVGSQVALARRESPSRGDQHVGLARALVQEMPATLASVTAGETSEWRATIVAQGTATLSREDRAEVDRRLAPDLPVLGDRALAGAVRRLAAELDAASVLARMRRAVAGRRLSVRPADDGMAYLTVLGPLAECVGAYASLQRAAQSVVGGYADSGEHPDGRSRGQVMADLALRLMSGRSMTEPQPVEVALVMTDTALLGIGPGRTGSPEEPALLTGATPTPIPAAFARRLVLADAAEGGGQPEEEATVWLRRLYTSPDQRDLVAMDSRRRLFTGALRRFLVLRDKTCTTPWCDAAIRDLDHATPHRNGGCTDAADGNGQCQRCNLTKEAPGWRVRPVGAPGVGPHRLELTTPTGSRHHSTAPPLLGWGWRPPDCRPDLDDEVFSEMVRRLTMDDAPDLEPWSTTDGDAELLAAV